MFFVSDCLIVCTAIDECIFFDAILNIGTSIVNDVIGGNFSTFIIPQIKAVFVVAAFSSNFSPD